MFDFIAEINTINSKSELNNEIFNSIDVYKKLNFNTNIIESENSKFVYLTKHSNTNSVFENEKYIVLIFGYCFTRINNSENSEKKRLFAENIADFYNKYQSEITKFIKGSYSVLIFEKEKKILNIFTDEFNLRKVYYAKINDKLLITNSLSVFPKYSENYFSKLNQKSLLEYYLFDFDLNNDTFIENVKVLDSGSHLKYSDNQISIKNYWNIFDHYNNLTPVLDKKASIIRIEKILKQNIKMYAENSEKTAFALTGGYDSRTNLALLNGNLKDKFFYSYGIKESFDVKISKKIASKFKLNFKSFLMDGDFEKKFDENAEISVGIGDGESEMNRANYIFAYKNIYKNYDYILTGLFGSELIKRPTSLGGYIDKNVKSILLSSNLEETFNEIIDKIKAKDFINQEVIDKYKNKIFEELKSNKFLNNNYETALKFFYYITGIGISKYFMKEIKVERPFVENLHPFLDIEFVDELLKTPFPWVFNWNTKKSLFENLKIHRFYACIIDMNNPKLANIISTHAYKPKYLLNKIYLPFLIIQYYYYSKKIKKIGIFKSQNLNENFYNKYKNELNIYSQVFNNQNIEYDFKKHMKNFTRLTSIQIWMKKSGIKI
ncbi:MAG: hypothetical protein JXA16_00805 [Bacteroidales bacterium]|nr:hypothetical protein [Bacteroidales bacterium]